MQTLDKRCSKCKILKPLEAFYNNSRAKDGKDAYCKRCRKITTTEYASNLTPEQRQQRRNQTLEYNLRKYGTTYPPYKARTEVIRKHEANAARNLSSSADTSQSSGNGKLSTSGKRPIVAR